MNDHDHFELSEEFRRELDSATRAAVPSRGLERRLVRELRRRGLVSQPRWTIGRPTTWSVALRVAAAVVIFAGGVAFGHSLGAARPLADHPAVRQASAWELAALVQRSGTTQAEALQHLAAQAKTTGPEGIDLAMEVAMSSIRATLYQMMLLDPANPVPARLLDDLGTGAPGGWTAVGASNEQWVISF
jgi:hypothetical protein